MPDDDRVATVHTASRFDGGSALAAMDSLTEEERSWIAGLRALATFCECHPELLGARGTNVSVYASSDHEKFEDLCAALEGGEAEVDEYGFVEVTRHFGPHRLSVRGWAEGCGFRKAEREETVTVTSWVRGAEVRS